MDYVLTANGITKRYKGCQVLKGINIHIPKGSVYGLVGKNGAGKTTLIRIICGLQEPDEGEFCLYGVKNSDTGITGERRRIGAIVETPALYPSMTATENMKQQIMLRGIPSYDTIPGLLDLVGLGGTERKKVRNYSLGMKQRLGIAMALVGKPDFVILDEPTNGLDPTGIVELRELIRVLNREKQITFLISSHILSELSLVSTHYGFIHEGQIEELTAEELSDRCSSLLHVEVDDVNKLSYVLDGMKLNYRIVSDTAADVYGSVDVTELAVALKQAGAKLSSAYEPKDKLETFFMTRIEGYHD